MITSNSTSWAQLKVVSAMMMLAALLLLTHSPAAWAALPTPDYVEGEVLVRFHAAQSLPAAQAAAARHGLEMVRHFDWLSAHEGQVVGLLRSPNLTTVALLARLRADPAVALAEPNYLRYPADLRTPNDPRFGELWGLRNTGQVVHGFQGTAGADIGFLKAWGLARPTTNQIVVGVIDSGIDPTHPDLAPNLWINPGEIPGNGLDDDGNGYVDDRHGYDFAMRTGTLADATYHGTHVAGTVAAAGHNNQGVLGVNYQARLMGLRISNSAGTMSSSAMIEAIQYATMMKNRGVNVVALNASLGGGSYSSTERSAIQAAGNAGIVFCAAAGNNSANNDSTPFYPASYRLPNMIAVAASDQNDALASFSNYGATTVDLAAPGANILSCTPLALPDTVSQVRQGTNVFLAGGLIYAGTTSGAGITATIYDCGIGNPGDFPAAVNNNIALIERGSITFAAKASAAKAAGARAAIIYNNVPGNFNGTLGSAGDWIPTVSLARADGQSLKALLPAVGMVLNMFSPSLIYRRSDGTSMATPHVSGAVAFDAMNFPADSVAQRIQRILATATPVPALAGKTITGARLNLARMADTDNNGLPDWWELQYFGQRTGINPNGDLDGDGAGNHAEFLAGTVPTNALSVLRLSLQVLDGGNQLTLEWPSAAGRYYRLLGSTNLDHGFDTVVQSNLSATPPLNLVTAAPPVHAESGFYRLQLEP
jgi:subtilisin family serine protease